MFYNPNVASDMEKIADCVDSMVYKAIEMEGTVTVSRPLHSFRRSIIDRASQGEHGIGIGKKVALCFYLI